MRLRNKYILALFIAAAAAAGIYVYLGKPGTAALYGILPRSIASVNGQPIYQNKFDKRLKLARQFLAKDSPEESQLKTNVLNQLLKEEKISQLAAQRGISVTKTEVDGEFSVIRQTYEKDSEFSFAEYLAFLNLSEDEFKQEIVRPNTLYTKLAVWHNSQSALNPEAFARLAQAQSELDRQTDFETVSRLYSDKSENNALLGDLGFVSLNTLLPELRDQLKDAATGSTKTVYTRYGIHIVKVTARDDRDGGRLYLKQIFIKSQDFGAWLDQETKNYRIKWG